MNKSAFPAALLLFGIALSGCPVYDSNDYGCYNDFDCAAGQLCDGSSLTCVNARGSSNTCSRPSDCGTSETCSRSGTCTVSSCHFSSVGCVRGYECSAEGSIWQCVAQGSGAGGSAAGAAGEANAGAPTVAAGAPSGGAAEPASSAGAGG